MEKLILALAGICVLDNRITDGLILELQQCPPHPFLIRSGDVDQQVDVARGPREAGLNDGHPANDHVGCTRCVQVSAESDKVR